MKKIQLLCIAILVVLAACTCDIGHNKGMTDPKILDLLQKMTLEEKVGQMQQLNGYWGEEMPQDFKSDLVAGKIGSILNEVNVAKVNEIQRIAVEESRLGIPIIFGRDVVHGFKTVFPIPLGQAASWNPNIVEEGARVAAQEAWSSGVHWTFAPMLDISRDARWGRIAESLGEDPYLASVLGAAMVKGFQGEDLSHKGTILACAKHFAGYGAAEGGRDYNTTLIPEGELRNVYLKPFLAAKNAGVGSFMSGFNDLNGVPVTGNSYLLRDVLRDEWGFDGFVVSDWTSITEMIAHGFAKDEKHAGQLAMNAGVDMEMASTSFRDNLVNLIAEGKIDEKRVDEAVYHILKIKFDLGLFDNPYVGEGEAYKFATPEYLEIAKEAAIQSMVLLKNENNLLPLSTQSNKVAVIGPMANQKYEQLGTWIFDGDSELSVTPVQALNDKIGKSRVIFEEGLSYSRSKSKAGFSKAVKAANKSDVVILCLGEESILSGEAHCRANIELPGAQEELFEALHKTGKPIVVVVMAGRPLAIGELAEKADAVLYAFHPGTMGGAALADLLVGDANPSGKLPVSFPRAAGQIPIYYNHKNTGRPVNPEQWLAIDDIPLETLQTSLGNTSHYLDFGYAPLYPFGYGLSYTNFEYSNLSVENPELVSGDTLVASVVLKNSGNFTGVEIVQLYVRDLVGDVTRPVKELKAFKRVALKPGETKKITFEIMVSDLAFYNQKMEYKTEAGDFQLWIGGCSDTNLMTSFEVK